MSSPTVELPAVPAAGPVLGRRVLGLPVVPNGVTLARTVGAMALATWAAAASSLALLVVGYLVYWAGDVADGALARRRGETTRVGAVLDIVSDRACTTMLATAFVVERPATAVPLALFLVQFCVLDTMLSLSFLATEVDSPNDFHRVDRTVYRLNWSPPAKALNTAAVVLLLLTGHMVAAAFVALGVTAVKLWSLRRVVRILARR